MSVKAQSSSFQEIEPNGDGTAVIEVMKTHWRQFDGQLYAMLRKQFGSVHNDHDEIVGSAMAKALEKAEVIEQSWRQSDRTIILAGWVYGFLRKTAEFGALGAIKKWNKNLRIGSGAKLLDEDSENEPARPVPILYADQEEIVFLKQLLEKLGCLEVYERSWLRTVIDRATLSEMCASNPRASKWVKTLSHGTQEEVSAVMREMKEFAS